MVHPRHAGPWRSEKGLREKIQAADAVVLLVTPAALESAWMMTELGMAEGFERLVVPVTAGLKPGDLPLPLQGYRLVPFDEVDEAIKALSEKLSAVAKH